MKAWQLIWSLTLFTSYWYFYMVFMNCLHDRFRWHSARHKRHYGYFILISLLIFFPTADSIYFQLLPGFFYTITQLVYFTLSIVLPKIYFRMPWGKTLLGFAYFLAFSGLIDLLSAVVIEKLLNLPLDPGSLVMQSIVFVPMSVGLLSATYAIHRFKDRTKPPVIQKIPLQEILGFRNLWWMVAALVLMLVGYQVYIDIREPGAFAYRYYLAYFLLIPGIVLLMIISYKIRRKQESLYIRHLEDHVQTLSNYTKSVENLYSDIRQYRHDLQNILLSIRSYLEAEDYEALKVFYFTNILSRSPVQNEMYQRLTALSKIRHEALKGLIFNKIEDIAAAGIRLELEIMDVVEDIKVDTIDLCRMVGILLDNAIESAVMSETKTVILAISRLDGCIQIAICNSFRESPDLKRMQSAHYSTKPDHMGIGLKSLQTLVSRHKQICLRCRLEDALFAQVLEIRE